MQFFKQSLITLGSRMLLLCFSLAVLVITTRVLGPEGRGLYALVILAATVAKNMSGLGVEISNVYFFGQDRIEPGRLASNSLIISLVAGTAAFLILYPLTGWNPGGMLDQVPRSLITAAGLGIPFYSAWTLASALYLGARRVALYNGLQLIQPAGLAITLAGLTLAGALRLGTAVWCWTGFHLAAAWIAWRLAARDMPFRLRWYGEAGKRQLGYGIQAHLANVLQFLNYRLDYFLINRFLALNAVGHYSIAVAMAEMLLHVPYAVGTVVLPRVSHSTGGESNRSTPVIFRLVLMILVCLSLAAMAAAAFLFPLLFSDRFNEALVPFYGLMPGVLAMGMSKVVVNDLAGRGKPVFNCIVSGVALACNIGLNLILIPKLGILGASVSSSITYSLSSAVLIAIYLRWTGIPAAHLFLPRKEDFRLLMNGVRSVRPGEKGR